MGKSSLINMLTNYSKLAKTSSSPGKTQLINHFLINDEWYLVDLPGYGYARTSKSQRGQFSSMIKNYILKRENMVCLFVLIDSRHDLRLAVLTLAVSQHFLVLKVDIACLCAFLFAPCNIFAE